MRILFATPYNFPVGGISLWAQHIVNYHRTLDDDFDIDVLAMDRKLPVSLQTNGLLRNITGFKEYFQYIHQEKQILDKQKYDVIHISSSASFSLLKDLWMINVAHARGVKAVVHFHFGRIPELKKSGNWEWKLLIRVIRKADCIIVLDNLSYQTLKMEGVNNIYKLPNPVAPIVSDYISSHNFKKIPRRIFFAGHGDITKGIFELVDACKRIPNVEVIMAGEIGDAMKQKLLVAANGGQWLNICGKLSFEQVLTNMMSCDLFILPTYTEGFPNVIIEAMACECAIVTCPVGAIPEMLEVDANGKYGLMVPPRNAEALYQAIMSIIDNEKLKNEFRFNAIRRINERYSMSIVWQQMTDIWKDLF